MPTGVKMLVRLDRLPGQFSLQDLRAEFLDAMSLNAKDDFYYEGPLVLVSEEDRAYMPVKDRQSSWLDVNLWKSYYGYGHAGGDLELFIKCAEWFERRLPNCQVYYGHDVSDENISLFDKAARERLLAHFRKTT